MTSSTCELRDAYYCLVLVWWGLISFLNGVFVYLVINSESFKLSLMLNMAFKMVTFSSDELPSDKYYIVYIAQVKLRSLPLLYYIRKDMEKAGNDDNNNIFVVALLSWLPHLVLLFGSQGSLGDWYCLSPPHPTDPVPSPLSCISCKQRHGGSLAGCVSSWDNLAMTWEPWAPGPIWTGPDQVRYTPNFVSIKMQKALRM